MTPVTRRQLLARGLGAGIAAAPLPRALAQSGAYPNKPVRIVVGAAPGGLSDADAPGMWREDAGVWIREVQALGVTLD